MTSRRHLANAPITEALIDVQVTPRAGFTYLDLKAAFADVDHGYYVKSPIVEKTLAFQWAPDALPPQTRTESSEVGHGVAAASAVLAEQLAFDADGRPFPEHANIVGWHDDAGTPDDELKHFWKTSGSENGSEVRLRSSFLA